MNSGGFNHQSGHQGQQRYVNHRSNYQGPNYRGNYHQHDGLAPHQQQMRGHSMGMQPTPAGMPQQPTPQQMQLPQPAQQSQPHNQSMQSQVSAGSSSLASSTAPQLVDLEYAKVYYQEIQQMFVSQDFKSADRREKKEIVGNIIYKHVEKIVGDQKAPKITGMLIDLPEAELNFSVSQWNHFEQKVMSAFQLITVAPAKESQAPGGASVSPEAQQAWV